MENNSSSYKNRIECSNIMRERRYWVQIKVQNLKMKAKEESKSGHHNPMVDDQTISMCAT